jgi:uncharacterized protein YprB with RNaseH-like and TPR domain
MTTRELRADLREQLRRLGVQRGIVAIKPPPPGKRGPAIEEVVNGELACTEHGSCFVSETAYPLDHCHGSLPLVAALEHDPQMAALLMQSGAAGGVDLRRAAFIDTETTGLAGGTGTYAFLVGVGYYTGDAFHVRQFFMRDVVEERALLHLVGETLGDSRAVVSFNGRAFDMPLLTTRFTLARMIPPLTDAPHLDLLLPARRLWRRRLDSCALSSLEENVLDVIREDADVPGWLIPSLYFDYLRTGDARPMKRVFYHNVQDILSLVTLTARLCSALADPLSEGSNLSDRDLYSLGRWYEKLNMPRRAEEAYQTVLAHPLSADVRDAARHDLSLLLKRHGRSDEAAVIWQEMAQDRYGYTVWACVELAKHYEWSLRDYPAAAQVTRLAIENLQSTPAGLRVQTELHELHHRLARLERKMAPAQESL